MKKLQILLISMLLVFSCISFAWAGDTAVKLSPPQIDIGLSFKGTQLTVSGQAPQGSDIFVKLASPDDSVLDLSKKGKVGIFWMNVENTTVTRVPKLYQIASSASIKDLPAALQDQMAVYTDFRNIYNNAVVEKHGDGNNTELTGANAGKYISTLISIYKKSGLYSVGEKAVKVNGNNFVTTFKLPPNIPQEKCQVTVYAVKDGKIIINDAKPLNVNSVGVVN